MPNFTWENEKMKQSVIDPEIQQHRSWKQWQQGIDQAHQLLNDELGDSAGLVQSRWQLVQNRDRDLLRLTISDFTGEASADLAPAELEHPSHLRDRLHRLWGELLRNSTHIQLERVKEVVQQLDGN